MPAPTAALAGAALAAVAAFAVAACDDDPERERRPVPQVTDGPNVVLIQADDQTLEMMRVMPRTRRLIGDRGVTFSHHFTNWPLCCPARTTQLTGKYAHNHGVLGNKPPDGSYLRYPQKNNLATWLAEAGYEVGHVGKFLNGYGVRDDYPGETGDDQTEVPPGWTAWRTGVGGNAFTYYGYRQNEFLEHGEVREGEVVEYGGSARDHKTDVNTADALELIDEFARRDAPFYLQVDYLPPHGGGPNDMPQPPFDCDDAGKPAPRHARAFDNEPLAALRDESFDERDVSDKPPAVASLDRLDRDEVRDIERIYRCELASLLAVDEGVAAIVERLREAGELEDTYLIYTSDNGSFHGEHRLRSGKNEAYEPAIRVPLLISGPKLPEGVTAGGMTSNADLAPTVLELTGVRAGGGGAPDGVSLLPVARDPDAESDRAVLIETNRFAGVRTLRYKLVSYADGFIELYDLQRDPFETENVADEPRYADVRAALEESLATLRDCAGADCVVRP